VDEVESSAASEIASYRFGFGLIAEWFAFVGGIVLLGQ
jgi:hypothetical protein